MTVCLSKLWDIARQATKPTKPLVKFSTCHFLQLCCASGTVTSKRSVKCSKNAVWILQWPIVVSLILSIHLVNFTWFWDTEHYQDPRNRHLMPAHLGKLKVNSVSYFCIVPLSWKLFAQAHSSGRLKPRAKFCVFFLFFFLRDNSGR